MPVSRRSFSNRPPRRPASPAEVASLFSSYKYNAPQIELRSEREDDEFQNKILAEEGMEDDGFLGATGPLEERTSEMSGNYDLHYLFSYKLSYFGLCIEQEAFEEYEDEEGDITPDYPDLMQTDPLMDPGEIVRFPPTNGSHSGKITLFNDTPMFLQESLERGVDWTSKAQQIPETTDVIDEESSGPETSPLSPEVTRELYRFPMVYRRATKQTGKGKIHRASTMVIVGDGNGMVGLGEGKDDDYIRAEAKAFAEAVRNMDYVDRFEGRTVWTDMETKLGSTRVYMRPRPVGFGLRCNPNLHQVFKAAGIKDVSAKVWGSRNPINVIKAAFRMLQGGNAPIAMGDGIGGGGRKLHKGTGMRNKSEVERDRGRRFIDLRT